MLSLALLAVTILISSVMSTSVCAQQPGDLDSTFGMDGRVFTDLAVPSFDFFFPSTESMLVQPDGKILVCGRFWEDVVSYSYGTFIVRYMPDGTLDTSFGDNGRVAFIPSGYPEGSQAVGADMALQPDGKIVLIGQGTIAETIMVQRYTTSGQLDTTFGNSGTTFVHGNAFEEGTSIAIQPDGKIVGVGWDYDPWVTPYYDAILLFRLNANGSLDTSFGLAGTGKVFIEDGYDQAEVLVQPDAKILVVGTLLNFTDVPAAILLARYSVDGSLDASFDTDGMVTHRINNMESYAWAAALQADGKIVVAGESNPQTDGTVTHRINKMDSSARAAALQTDGKIAVASGSNPHSVVVRYNSDGSLDTGFGTDGVVSLEMSFVAYPNTVLFQTNGKIVVTGENDFTVVRLNSDGTLDTVFGSGGRSVFPINAGGTNYANASVGALQPDGNILVAGYFEHYYTDSHEKLALIRVSGDPAGTGAPINVGHSGAWFNPATSGQGQFLDVEPDGQFSFLGWFTYTDDESGNPNEQHWFTAEGNYNGSTVELVLYESVGGQFDHPQAVTTTPVGNVTLSFADCNQGTMSYRFDDRDLEGSFPMIRVIPGSGNVCESRTESTMQAVNVNHGMDGAWFDPNTSGQGFFFDVHAGEAGSKVIFVSWFTYGEDTASGQRWLTAEGQFEGSKADLVIYDTNGGSFDDPRSAESVQVGTMRIDFSDCSHAVLSYSLPAEGSEGNIDIQRAVPGGQGLCEELNAF